MANETMEFDLLINGDPAKSEIKSVKREIDNLGNSGQNAGRQFGDSWVMAGAKVAAALYSIKKAFDFAREIDNLTTRLQSATGSAESARAKFNELDVMANKMGLSTQSLAESYASFRLSADLAGSSSANTEKIFKSVATASSAMKLSADDTKGVFMALSQMLSKGTVSSEELRQQFGERIPGAMSMAAKAMGMTDAEFNKQLATGKIMANDLLPKLADELDNTFGQGAQNAAGSLNALYARTSNLFLEVKDNVKSLVETSGLAGWLASAIDWGGKFNDMLGVMVKKTKDLSTAQLELKLQLNAEEIKKFDEKIKAGPNAFEKIFNVDQTYYKTQRDKALKQRQELMLLYTAPTMGTKGEKPPPPPPESKKTDPWIAEKQKLELMTITETSNAYQKQYETLESQRQADLKKFGTTTEKKALINKAYDAQQRALREKVITETEDAYTKETDKILEEVSREFNGLKSSSEDYKKTTDEMFADIEDSFKGLTSSTTEYKRNQEDAFKVREMAIGLLDDENSKIVALAQLEYEKNKANLEYLLQDNQISQENYNNQMKYLELIREKAIKSTSEIEQIMKGISSGVQGAFANFFDFTSKGFLNFKNLANSILIEIYKKMLMMKIINPMMSSFGFTGMGFAKGGVFGNEGLQRYAQGGVINSPTQFRFAGGAGIMGEKGSEAIMPLKRMQNGNLGVESAVPTMKVEIKNESGSKMEVTSSTVSQDTEGMVLGIVINAVNTNKMGTRDMIRGLR